jgi:hypothetical protein
MVFLGDLVNLFGLELPMQRFSSGQKQFFVNTNIGKDYLLQQRGSYGFREPLK